MASSGYVESNDYNGRYILFEWETVSVSSVNNTRTIYYKATALGGSASWYYHHNNTIYINGDLMYEGPETEQVYDGDVLDEGTYTINQNYTTNLRVDLDGGIYVYDNNINTGMDWTLDTIPRYTSIKSFSVSKRNETSVVYSFSTADICDYAWYSINNGSSWTGVDITDGTSASFNVTGLNPNTTYNFKVRVRRKDSQLTTDSGTVSQTTYKAPIQSFTGKTETTISMSWSIDSTADYIWYSINNGSSWTAVGSVNSTSGSYTISGLANGTTYNIKTRVRRKAPQTSYDTTAASISTYSYPYVSIVGTSSLTIGNSQTLTLYNPLSRSVTVKMNQNSTSGTQLYSGTTSGTSISFTPNANTLYASIPNSATGNCVYSVVYGSSTKATGTYTYKIIGTEKPVFSDFTFQNSNNTVYNDSKTLNDLTGSNQIIVKGFSDITATITDANKATAVNNASMKNYSLTVGTKIAENSTLTYPLNIAVSKVDGANVIVAAVDTRGISKLVTKQATFKNYTDLTINALSLSRTNNGAGPNVVIAFNGTIWNNSFGSISNTIVSATFQYKKTTESSWSSEYSLGTPTISGNSYSASVTPNVEFDLESSYYISIKIKDYLETKTITSTVNAGTPALTIYKDNVAIGKSYDTNKGQKLQVHGKMIADQLIGSLGGNYINSRDYAVCKSNKNTATSSAYYPVVSQKTKNGEWSIGSLGNDDLLRFCYTTDSNYSAGTNSNVNWTLDNTGNFSVIAKNVYEKKSLSSKSHSGWGTNNEYVPDMSFIAYWNGAHNSSNSSNLTYAHEGTIQCKPTNLYNNTSGTTGTVNLSETAANFNYLEIYFRTNDTTNYVSGTKVYSPNGKIVPLNYVLASDAIYNKYVLVTISAKTITPSNGRQYYFTDGGTPHIQTGNYVYIVRVDGYK